MSWLEDPGARLDEDELAREVELERRARHAPIAPAVPWMRVRVRMRTTAGEVWERTTLSVQEGELLIEFDTIPESVAIPLEKVRGLVGSA